jgi:hypothetical protein
MTSESSKNTREAWSDGISFPNKFIFVGWKSAAISDIALHQHTDIHRNGNRLSALKIVEI